MPDPINRVQVFKILRENQRRNGNPMGVEPEVLVDWSKDQRFYSSSTIIYTGSLYQMMPKAEKFVDLMLKSEMDSRYSLALRMIGSKTASTLASKLVKEDKDKSERAKRILRNASKLLIQNGIDHSYLADDEPYSGILFYDLGLLDQFSDLASSAVKIFKERGVRRIITVDPHSTYAFRELYPKFVEGFDFEVKHYMEVATPMKNDKIKGTFAIHDPCVLSRHLSLGEAYRKYIDALGVDYVEPERSGKMTFCCGGPVESLAPAVSSSIANIRCSQLRDKSKKAVVACPICLSNLGRCGNISSQDKSIEVFDALELTYYG